MNCETIVTAREFTTDYVDVVFGGGCSTLCNNLSPGCCADEHQNHALIRRPNCRRYAVSLEPNLNPVRQITARCLNYSASGLIQILR